jgi:hypothetical protein
MKYSFHRTLWNARLTVDAFVWMNVNHLVAFIKTFNRTDYNAICVFAGEAGFGDDMRHIRLTPYQKT